MLHASRLLLLATATCGCVAGLPVALAQDTSAWDQQAHGAARLIAGALAQTAAPAYVRAGVEIRLDPGWKTYWRDPGDSGVPPTFDFTGSTNVKSVAVQWPAPEPFSDDAGGHSIGYKDHVIIPLRVFPETAAAESSLQLKLGFAICGNLCVPAEVKLRLRLSGKGAEETDIEKAELSVPRRVALGAGKALAIRSVHREAGSNGHDHVVVEVAAPDSVPVDLFVEGPAPAWSLPLPKPSGTAAGLRRFTFDLDGLPPGAEAKGAMLTLTAVSSSDAIEVVTRLD